MTWTKIPYLLISGAAAAVLILFFGVGASQLHAQPRSFLQQHEFDETPVASGTRTEPPEVEEHETVKPPKPEVEDENETETDDDNDKPEAKQNQTEEKHESKQATQHENEHGENGKHETEKHD